MAKSKTAKEQINYSEQTQEEKEKALETALADIAKKHGKGAVMKLGENTKNRDIRVTPTGCLGLDIALGIGGLPSGRIIEVYGPESSGKTTITLHAIAEVQKRGGVAAFIDAEHALDPVYAGKLGVNIDELYISQPDDGEQALEITESMVRSGAIDLVIVDSVAALVPRAEIEGEMGDSHMGLQARLMSQALRKLAGIVNKTSCTVIFINQLREKIGGGGYGPSETTTGGRALKFYASIRIDIRRIETLKGSDEMIGNRTRAKIAKNKMAPPFKQHEFDIMFGEGISKWGDLVDIGVELGIVGKSGSWFSMGDKKIGQGRENAKTFFKENPEAAIDVENKIRAHYDLPGIDGHAIIESPTDEVETGEMPEETPTKPAKKSTAKKSAVKPTPEPEEEMEIIFE